MDAGDKNLSAIELGPFFYQRGKSGGYGCWPGWGSWGWKIENDAGWSIMYNSWSVQGRVQRQRGVTSKSPASRSTVRYCTCILALFELKTGICTIHVSHLGIHRCTKLDFNPELYYENFKSSVQYWHSSSKMMFWSDLLPCHTWRLCQSNGIFIWDFFQRLFFSLPCWHFLRQIVALNLRMLFKFLQFCYEIFQKDRIPSTNKTWPKLRILTPSKGTLLPRTHTLARHKLISLSGFWSRGLHVNFERRAGASSSVPHFKGILQHNEFAKQWRPSTSSGPPEPHKASTSTAAAWHRVQMFWLRSSVFLGGYLGERISTGPDRFLFRTMLVMLMWGWRGPTAGSVRRRGSLSIQNILVVVVLYSSVCLLCVHYKAQSLHAI